MSKVLNVQIEHFSEGNYYRLPLNLTFKSFDCDLKTLKCNIITEYNLKIYKDLKTFKNIKDRKKFIKDFYFKNKCSDVFFYTERGLGIDCGIII